MSNERKSRLNEARILVAQLLNELEGSSATIEHILMKGLRLARLTKDGNAQAWLGFEMRGYQDGFKLSDIGYCKKYAFISGRLKKQENGNISYTFASLPEVEAQATSLQLRFDQTQFVQPALNARNYTEKSATEALINSQSQKLYELQKSLVATKSRLASLKSAIHSFATDVQIAVELGDAAQDIFESARIDVDKFIRSFCPSAAEKLVAVNDRMIEGTKESFSAALTSCRRLLMDIADALYPASNEAWLDRSGKPRKVGIDQYKNRILAYLSDRVTGEGSFAIINAELELVASKLDAVYEKTCKGVHTDVSEQEARLAVIHTYLLIAEVAQYEYDAK